MKRHVVQLVAFLLLGVLINLTIAWGCAILLPGEGDWPTYEGSWASGEKEEAYLRRTLGKIHHIPEGYPASSSSERGIGWTRSQADVGHVYGGGMVSAGWPLRTLRGALFVVGGPTGSEDIVHALLLPAGASGRVAASVAASTVAAAVAGEGGGAAVGVSRWQPSTMTSPMATEEAAARPGCPHRLVKVPSG